MAIMVASVLPVEVAPYVWGEQLNESPRLVGEQGDVLLVRISLADHPLTVVGTFLRRQVPFVSVGDGPDYVGLLGIDMQDTPGSYALKIKASYPDHTVPMSMSVRVINHAYPVQRLTLPRTMVDLDKNTLVRVKAEAKTIKNVFLGLTKERWWMSAFVKPVEGKVSGRFGSQRIINGAPRSPHSGEDIAAPRGTAVVAMNEGMVRLTMDHFFTGKGVIIDHGLGLFSMYFHLSAIEVDQDQRVRKGQVIGKVGSTGRATGPHLHWGVRLNGARVNPYALLSIPAEGFSQPE